MVRSLWILHRPNLPRYNKHDIAKTTDFSREANASVYLAFAVGVTFNDNVEKEREREREREIEVFSTSHA